MVAVRPSLVLLRCTTTLSFAPPVSSVPCQVPSMSWPCAANAADRASATMRIFVTVWDLLPPIMDLLAAGGVNLSRGNRHGRAGGAVNIDHQRHLAVAERLGIGKLNLQHRRGRRLARGRGGDLSDAQHRHEHA